MDQIIVTTELTKRFGDVLAVNRVNLQVNKGEIFGLLGPNGSGKTTMVRMLCGLMTPSGGRADVVGFDVASHAEQVKANIGHELRIASTNHGAGLDVVLPDFAALGICTCTVLALAVLLFKKRLE